MSWAAPEFKEIDLGDERLNKRTVLLAECMAANPLASIPQACGSWAQTQAAYRYLAQDEISGRTSWSPICEARRCACVPTLWCCASRTRPSWTSMANASRAWGEWHLLKPLRVEVSPPSR